MVHNVNSVSDPSLPSSGVPKEESKGTLGPHQVQVSDPGKAIVPWHGTPESTGAPSGWVASPPKPPRQPNKPTSAPLLPAPKQKPQRPAITLDYLRDKILKLAASDVRTNLNWRARLSETRDAKGRPKAQGIATLHESTRSKFRGNVHTRPDLKALSKCVEMSIDYLGITFYLDSHDLPDLPPKINTLELKPSLLLSDAEPFAKVPLGIGKFEIFALRLTSMLFTSNNVADIAQIKNLHHLTLNGGRANIHDLAAALREAVSFQDFRLINAALWDPDPEYIYGPCTAKGCRSFMEELSQIPHLRSLTLEGVRDIVSAPAPQAQETQTAYPSTPPQTRRLALTEVQPLLTGFQTRLDLSNNEIAFDVDTIPMLGAKLEWLNLKGNPISPETVQQMRARYPGTHIEADEAVQPTNTPQSH